jgi:hypothetical protein
VTLMGSRAETVGAAHPQPWLSPGVKSLYQPGSQRGSQRQTILLSDDFKVRKHKEK